MHDKHGREIHEGDIVIGKSWIHGHKDKPLLVVGCNPSATSCNVTCTPVHAPTAAHSSWNSSEVVVAVKADGTIVPEPTTGAPK